MQLRTSFLALLAATFWLTGVPPAAAQPDDARERDFHTDRDRRDDDRRDDDRRNDDRRNDDWRNDDWRDRDRRDGDWRDGDWRDDRRDDDWRDNDRWDDDRRDGGRRDRHDSDRWFDPDWWYEGGRPGRPLPPGWRDDRWRGGPPDWRRPGDGRWIPPRPAPPPQQRPALGVMLADSARRGVLVTSVVPGGPAANAGLRRGDRIIAIDRRAVDTQADAMRVLGQHRPGDRVTLHYARNGRLQRTAAQLESFRRVF